MFNFNAGALRPATDDARAETFSAANDLVRKTLSQHGLWNDADATEGALPMNDLMKGFKGLPAMQSGLRPAAQALDLPEGAVFRSESHTGRSGTRAYRQYIPASASMGVEGIVLMLHGCTQTPEDFAIGTGMNAQGEAHRLVVIYPEQARGANAQTCWNWFSKGDQKRDRGEPEILVGIIRKAMAEHGVPPERVFVAGLSAGAAMAVILGEIYPDLFAGVGAHSGLPYGAAHDVPSAFAAMAGDLQHAVRTPPAARGMRTIAFHGRADRTVVAANSIEIVRRAANGTPHAVETSNTGAQGGRNFQRTLTSDSAGQVVAEHWQIDGLAHAWSGGNKAGSYADPSGPDASAEMVRFFLDRPVESVQ